MLALSVDSKTGYAWSTTGLIVAFDLQVGGEANPRLLSDSVRIPYMAALVAVGQRTLAYATFTEIHTLDISKEISCSDNPALTLGVKPLVSETPGIVRMFNKYSKGVKLKSNGEVWAFTGYKKNSINKKYGSNTNVFHFTKSVLCSRLCSVEAGMCTNQTTIGDEKCCVDKSLEPGTAIDKKQSCAAMWTNKFADPKPMASLKHADGMKLF